MDPAEDLERYFAFGANLNPSTLARRGVRALRAEPARLPDHRLVFDVRGLPVFEPRFASVRPAAGEEVWGALLVLGARDMARIRSFEGRSYRDVEVEVETGAGRVRARTFVNPRPAREGEPSSRYRDVILAGARHHRLPQAWIERLERQPCRHLPVLHGLWNASFALVDGVHRSLTSPTERR